MRLPNGPRFRINIRDAAAFTAAGAAYFALIWWSGSNTPCLLRTLTGFPCPGCGLTTAVKALLRMDFGGAWTAHAGIFLIPLIALAWCLRKRAVKTVHFTAATILFFFLAYFFIRLLLCYPDGPYPMVQNPDNVLNRIFQLLRAIFSGISARPM